MAFAITSAAFQPNGEIPTKYTCEGQDISPQISWSNPPAGVKSFVLIVDDPDAPDPKAPKMTYVHWLLYNIPPNINSLAENVHSVGLPQGTEEGVNDWKRTGYGGPCPPIGRHRYFFKLYALDTTLTNLNKPTKKDLEAAIQGHILGEAQIVGTYQKQK